MFAAARATTPMTRSMHLDFQSTIHQMDPSIGKDTPKFRAAMLLLALTVHPPQIDHLSRALNIPREFLARCMRRLVDNGVLQKDKLVAGWSPSSMNAEAFWADVNVATGQWLRRHDARGSLEWTEAGGWQKPYDYTALEITESSTKYIVSDERRPQLLLNCLGTGLDSRLGGWIGMTPSMVFGNPDLNLPGTPDRQGVGEMAALGIGLAGAPGSSAGMNVWLS